MKTRSPSVVAHYFFLAHVLFVTPVSCMSSSYYRKITSLVTDGTAVVSSQLGSSTLRCASKCFGESMENRCTIAMYNKTSGSCTLTTSSVASLIYSSQNDTVTLFPLIDCDTKALPHIDPNEGQYTEGIGGYFQSNWHYLICADGYGLSLANDMNFFVCDVNGEWLQNDLKCLPRDETRYVEGRNFVTAFLPNYGMEMEKVSVHLYIIPSDGNTTAQYSTVTVSAPYVSFNQKFTLTELLHVEIPIGIINETTDVGIPNAVTVSSTKPVTVFAMNNNKYSSGGMLVLPTQSLSTSYLVASTPYDDFRSSLMIIAVERAQVNVSFPDGTDITASIEGGDTYHITRRGLSGAIIEADKDIAVLAGEWCANLPDQGNYSCDHIVEQMPPIGALDTLYIVAQPEPRTTYMVNVAAVKDNTSIFLRNASDMYIYVGVLNHGETFSRTFEQVPLLSVTADNPILVTQYGVSASVDDAIHGDASMFVVPGANHFLNKYRFMVPEGYHTNKIMIIFNITSTGVAQIADPRTGLIHNGLPVASVDMESVLVNGEEFGVCYLPLLGGVHQIENSVEFGAVLYGQNPLNEYAWNLGMYMWSR